MIRHFVTLLLLGLVTACVHSPPKAPRGFTETYRDVGGYRLYVLERIPRPDQPISLWIEGDGLAFNSFGDPSKDPTPRNPVAMELAARDSFANVVYVGRPCQYLKTNACTDRSIWTKQRFTPAMARLYGDIARAYGRNGLILNGYSGGGALAVLAAHDARNSGIEIKAIRSVAANLDLDLFQRTHKLAPERQWANPTLIAPALADIAQIHYAGADDKVVPPNIAQSYRRASGATSCVQTQTLAGIDHAGNWDKLKLIVPTC